MLPMQCGFRSLAARLSSTTLTATALPLKALPLLPLPRARATLKVSSLIAYAMH